MYKRQILDKNFASVRLHVEKEGDSLQKSIAETVIKRSEAALRLATQKRMGGGAANIVKSIQQHAGLTLEGGIRQRGHAGRRLKQQIQRQHELAKEIKKLETAEKAVAKDKDNLTSSQLADSEKSRKDAERRINNAKLLRSILTKAGQEYDYSHKDIKKAIAEMRKVWDPKKSGSTAKVVDAGLDTLKASLKKIKEDAIMGIFPADHLVVGLSLIHI